MALLRLEGVGLAAGGRPLLEEAELAVEPGERVALVGRNGTGKSTLLEVLAGQREPEEGEVWRAPGLRTGHLPQYAEIDADGSVFDVVSAGLARAGDLLRRHHELSARLGAGATAAELATLNRLQQELEACDGWRLQQRVEAAISRLGLDPEARVSTLSGGGRRRVLLARALVNEPDLLLLDEPTNHLDIEAVTRLEELLAGLPAAVVFVTHDRAFLRRLATRIVDLDLRRLTSWPGDYERYLERKAEWLEAEARARRRQDKRLAEEEAWLRQGVKARRRRDQGRLRALAALRQARARRAEAVGQARLEAEAGELSGKVVVEARNLVVRAGDRVLVDGFSIRIMRGDRVGVVGPNGCGKTTLLRVLLGERVPEAGTVHRGSRVRVAYFDQERRALDPAATVLDNLDHGAQAVTVNGRSCSVFGYLRRFLFTPEQIQSPVSALSGGERSRLMLARLFTRPANLLVLDEPTNDLDVETLELLEELVAEYEGTVIVVSHDREFLDRTVTSLVAFEGGGRVHEYVGGWSDWMRQRSRNRKPEPDVIKVRDTAADKRRTRERARAPRLGYREQRELAGLPERIEALEAEQAALNAAMCEPDFFRRDGAEIAAARSRLAVLEAELEQAYARWQELEALAAGGAGRDGPAAS